VSAPALVIIADDLSGAAETAGAVAAASGSRAQVWLGAPRRFDAPVVAIDTGSRASSGEDAAAALRAALGAIPEGARVYKKIDSLLRGNVGAEVRELLALGLPVLVAAAVPRIGRTVRGGVVHVDGVPLHETDLWRAEVGRPPASIAESLGVPSAVLPLGVVRSGGLGDAIRSALAEGLVPVCDAETEDDLDLLAAAVTGLDPRLVVVGSAGLARALAQHLGLEASGPRFVPGADRVVTVVGSIAASIPAQVTRLVAQGSARVELGSGAVPDGDAVVTLGTWDAAAFESLAREVRGLAGRTDLVLTGGDTARRVLDALGVDCIFPEYEIHDGAVLSTTATGTGIVTRPGSYGSDGSLAQIVSHLKGTPAMSSLPTIALTMGDGAGVGPEVCIAAALDPGLQSTARLVIIGDAGRLRQAAAILGSTEPIEVIGSVDEWQPGRINVIDLALLPDDLPWGELSPVAGDAAFHYVRVACELAVAGTVQAIATAPLNKEALHLAGHLYPGHTELLAALTGTEEVSMLLSTPKVKVIHVTTHIGLIDAIARIEPGLVERTIRRGWSAMRASGIANPRIGVCAINPHAGEHGLFGYDEEATKIAPAVGLLAAEGMDVHGPLPADTAFFLAGRGDYDLIVAMYHDQGHGPVKVLGIEAGTNITVGLPVIRTSVDHGTAFDIAGKGVVDGRSMVEAVRQAIEMSGTA
jgi:4-hydroxythreonine-4-phosphate dehydrogenase